MALSRDDCAEILRHVQRELQDRDPALRERLSVRLERSPDPRRELLAYLNDVAEAAGLRSVGAQRQALDSLNAVVRTESGLPIDSIQVELGPLDMEQYETERLNLASLPDRSAPIGRLRELANLIEAEIDWDEDSREREQ